MFFVWCDKLWSSSFGKYLPFFFSSPLKLRLWLGHSRTFTELCVCVFRVTVGRYTFCSVWGSECSGLGISIFWCIEFFFLSDESLNSCYESLRDCYQHTLLLGCTLQVMSRAGFLQTWCLEVMCEGPLGAFSKCVFFCLHWGEDWVWPHHYKAPIGGVLQWCLSFCIWSWSSTRETIRFLATTLSPSPSVARFGQETSSKKSPGFKLLPLRVTDLLTPGLDLYFDMHHQLLDVCAFPNHTQLIEFATGWLHSKCSNIYKQYECSWTKLQLSQIKVLILMQ